MTRRLLSLVLLWLITSALAQSPGLMTASPNDRIAAPGEYALPDGRAMLKVDYQNRGLDVGLGLEQGFTEVVQTCQSRSVWRLTNF